MRRGMLTVLCCLALLVSLLGTGLNAFAAFCPMARHDAVMAEGIPCCDDREHDNGPAKSPLCKFNIGCQTTTPLSSPPAAFVFALPVTLDVVAVETTLSTLDRPGGLWRPPRA